MSLLDANMYVFLVIMALVVAEVCLMVDSNC